MQKRRILQWMIFLMVVSNTLVTMSINIAIVSMVNFHEDSEQSNGSNDITCPNTTFILRDLLGTDDTKEIQVLPYSEKTTYNWSKEERNMALAGYYWLNYISILPAGILAHKYGAKGVAGYGQLIASCMSSLIPIFAGYGPVVVAWIRALQGVLSFMAVPAGLFTIIGNWSPPQERGMFGASAAVGSGLAQTLGSIVFGYIARYTNWQYVFHVTSLFGVVWAALWFVLVYEFPREHPTITEEEKIYIESSIQSTDQLDKREVPWKSIITSIPFIVCTLASNSSIWVFVMLATYTPIYLKSMYGLNSDEIGIINSVCLFSTTFVALPTGYFNDILIERKMLTLRGTRKLHTWIGCVSCIPLIAMAFIKCDINVIIICLLSTAILRGGFSYGAPMGIVDISPKFSGILEGICGTSGSIQTFIFSTAISYYSGVLNLEDLWKYVFQFTALYYILTNVIYIIFGSSEVQFWSFENENPIKNAQ